MRKNCSSDREKLLKFEAEGRELVKFLRSLEQFLVTECFFNFIKIQKKLINQISKGQSNEIFGGCFQKFNFDTNSIRTKIHKEVIIIFIIVAVWCYDTKKN